MMEGNKSRAHVVDILAANHQVRFYLLDCCRDIVFDHDNTSDSSLSHIEESLKSKI